jgi:cysteine desulfurase
MSLYFDSTARHRILPEVHEAVCDVMEWCGNPSSLHHEGIKAKELLNYARHQLAQSINAEDDEIIFCANASMANTLALNQRPYVITSAYEHDSIDTHKNISMRLKEDEYEDMFSAHWLDKSFLFSHMLVNNETGEIYDIKSLIDKFHRRDIISHVDATAAFGNISIDVKKLDCDMLTIDGMKFGALTGCGALFVKHDLIKSMKPIVYGHQQYGIVGGTENLIGIVAMGKAAEIATKNMCSKNNINMMLKKYCIDRMTDAKLDYYIPANSNKCVPSILNICFKNIEGEALMNYLDANGICVASGSACNSGNLEPSHVLKALNVPEEYIHGSIRISFCEDNTIEDVEFLADKICEFMEMVK